MKRVTVNFKDAGVTSDSAAEDLLRRCREEKREYRYDRRNGIYCIAPTNDIVCYINYLDYLNSLYNEWKSYGYFDLGLIPLIMAPSFMQDTLMNDLGVIVRAWSIPIYTMNACSFLGGSYFGTKDSWVKRTDFAAVTGLPENTACLSKHLRNIMEANGLV